MFWHRSTSPIWTAARNKLCRRSTSRRRDFRIVVSLPCLDGFVCTLRRGNALRVVQPERYASYKRFVCLSVSSTDPPRFASRLTTGNKLAESRTSDF
jgi:hypothetical protein